MTPSEVLFVRWVKVGSYPGTDNGLAGSRAARSRDGTNGPVLDMYVGDHAGLQGGWVPAGDKGAELSVFGWTGSPGVHVDGAQPPRSNPGLYRGPRAAQTDHHRLMA